MATAKSTRVLDGDACGFLDLTGTPEALAADRHDPARMAAGRAEARALADAQLRRCLGRGTARPRRCCRLGAPPGASPAARFGCGSGRATRAWSAAGPTDPEAPRRALERHRALVRARRDAQYHSFMRAATA